MANQYFNAAYYLATNPDLYLAGVLTAEAAESHYDTYGAAEGRAPAPWFNAQFYLLSNPDLVAAGVTMQTALAHYSQYGINEGRAPSASINPADFDGGAYATANPDLVTAFGIADAANPTAAQDALLLSHFLAYGYAEHRLGVSGAFQTLEQDTVITALDNTITNGTFGDDTFSLVANATSAVVNGLGGTDTLIVQGGGTNSVTVNSIENINVLPGADLTVIGSGVDTVTAAGALTYHGALVNTFALGNGAVTADFSGVTGTTDNLALKLGAGITGDFTTAGIEHITAALGTTVVPTGLNLVADAVNGASFTLDLTGGLADQVSTVNVDSTGSGDLTTVTINGAAALSDLIITVGSTLAAVNTTITGGAGADTLTGAADLQHGTIMAGGAGGDTLVASVGIDTMSGGAGDDLFQFGVGTAVGRMDVAQVQFTSIDSISDFSHGDTLALAGTAAGTATFAGLGTVDGATGAITFETGYNAGSKTLATIVGDIDTAVNAVGVNVLFHLGSDTYLVHTAATTDAAEIIKLTGVALADVTASGAGVVHA